MKRPKETIISDDANPTMIFQSVSQNGLKSDSNTSIQPEINKEESVIPEKSENLLSNTRTGPTRPTNGCNPLPNKHNAPRNYYNSLSLRNHYIKNMININEHNSKKDRERKRKERSSSFDDSNNKNNTVTVAIEKDVDFTALQIKLQAEIEAGEEAKQAYAALNGSRSKVSKKRRRSSDGARSSEKKKKTANKKNADKKEKRKRKRDEIGLDLETDAEKKNKRKRKRE